MSLRVRLLCVLCAVPFVLSNQKLTKEYVCQDPDTGSLHEINTTWRSTTFCGNYTCKIRRINTGQQPSKVFVSLFNPQSKAANSNDKTNHTSEFILTKILPDLTKDNDRLLNKAEIQKITELLHSVKKSDLQAVIELYNVAQEIYKDMKVTDTKTDSRTSEGTSEESKETTQPKVSYWYEPINEHGKAGDLKTEGSEIKGTTLYPPRPYGQPYYYSQSQTNYPSYFSGSLLNNGDFGRVGYYNSYVNRPSPPSYYQQRNAFDASGTSPQTPCNPCHRVYQHQMPLPAYYPQRPANNLQPYPPFYNYTVYGYNNYYKGNPWTYYDYYKNLPYQTAAQDQRNQQAVAENIANDNNVNTEIKEDEKSWKTDSLSEEVINEIRANIAQRGKLINLPIKKRLKLERVSKVIKLDQNNRKTRSIPSTGISEEKSRESGTSQEEIKTEPQIFETYVERVTCAPTTELGYFKIGNMTKPFPHCCPQKIDDKQIENKQR